VRGACPTRHALGLAQCEQQLQLLLEQVVVVAEVVAEERERLDERAAAGHDLGATAREQVDGREVLEDPDGVVRAEHRHCARQPDPFGTDRRRTEDDGRGGDGEVGAVMLSDAEDVEPEPVGELDLLHQVAKPLRRVDCVPARRIRAEFRERVDA
jgi:hypothetical protein